MLFRSISRSKFSVEYPANIMLIASMNPCPCGYYNHPTKECNCPPGEVQKYLSKISGPLLDRIDIHIEVIPVELDKITNPSDSEASSVVRTRVIAARAIQTKRFQSYPGIYCNAQMTSPLLKKYCPLDDKCVALLKIAMQRFGLSARAYDRIIKLSRTIADLYIAYYSRNSGKVKRVHDFFTMMFSKLTFCNDLMLKFVKKYAIIRQIIY